MKANWLWSLWQAILLSFALGFTRRGRQRFVQWVTGLALNVEEHTITQSLIGLGRVRDWKALEISLVGDTFWERCQVRLARAEDQAFRAQVRAFLDATAGDRPPADKADFRRRCLEDVLWTLLNSQEFLFNH